MSKHSKSKRAVQQGADAVKHVNAEQHLNKEIKETQQEVQKNITLGGN
ncbi:hypothetical protein SAMN04488137_0902 [Fictibacillus solisalsi]|uniref:Uncharacterized protein n=1 Tax=Fictibacillus solisalsi TaxID=459525 RepID=A0A1G9UFW9_9BACL|nr:hypothetical protein [Fictibacillus solisalsi]SDM58821.1 hypothetical protein SAMN04488137_0902 [Fictibacillus solisalsi]